VPFRDPLIKGFGQTQKKGISIALSMANPDATWCNLQPQKQNMSTWKKKKICKVSTKPEQKTLHCYSTSPNQRSQERLYSK